MYLIDYSKHQCKQKEMHTNYFMWFVFVKLKIMSNVKINYL